MNFTIAVAVLALAAAPAAPQVDLPHPGDEVDVTAGAVTALSCAQTVRDHGKLDALSACSYAEAKKEIVVYDVAEKQIYRLTGKLVYRWQLEGAFGGGSVDFIGTVTRADAKTGVVVVKVDEINVAPKPKAGAFKGCL